jgi:hypothetical protein
MIGSPLNAAPPWSHVGPGRFWARTPSPSPYLRRGRRPFRARHGDDRDIAWELEDAVRRKVKIPRPRSRFSGEPRRVKTALEAMLLPSEARGTGPTGPRPRLAVTFSPASSQALRPEPQQGKRRESPHQPLSRHPASRSVLVKFRTGSECCTAHTGPAKGAPASTIREKPGSPSAGASRDWHPLTRVASSSRGSRRLDMRDA